MIKNTSDLNELIKNNLSIFAVVVAVPVIVLMCAISYQGYVSAAEERDMLKQELVGLRTSADTVRQNENSLQQRIDDYNQVLGTVIPEREDYFTIIFALEKLSQDTGFTIVRYEISLEESKDDRMSLAVEGSGDIDSFLNFLRDYQFKGNRLITNEKIELSESNEGRTRLSLNFYHKALPGLVQTVKPISEKDINLVQDIQSKITINIKPSDEDITDTDYETKENPF